MRVLLDTHAFLWWIIDDTQLSETAQNIIRNIHNTIFVSAACGWEIAIKARLGKLSLAQQPMSFVTSELARNGFTELPITFSHAVHTYTLPHHHRDPFDRIMIAQSQLENLPILSTDKIMKRYFVQVIW